MTFSPYLPDLKALELLLTVARTGSFGAAGRELGLTQQAVSSRVRSIEALVGVRLVERGARGSSLTESGALLADWAVRVVQAAEELDAAIGALRGGRDSRLDVAASFTVAEYLLPAWLARLRPRLRPDAGVNLVVRNSDQVASLVLTGAADVGFVEGPELPAGLGSAVIGRDELVLVVDPGHRWAVRRRAVGVEELAGTPLVVREEGSGTRRVLERALDRLAPDAARAAAALELSATTSIRQAVQAGAGPAVLSDLAVREDIAAGLLVKVRMPDGLRLRRELRAVWPEGRIPAGPARALLGIAGVRT